MIISHPLVHACLLEDDLGEHDVVGRYIFAPGEGTGMLVVPATEAALHITKVDAFGGWGGMGLLHRAQRYAITHVAPASHGMQGLRLYKYD